MDSEVEIIRKSKEYWENKFSLKSDFSRKDSEQADALVDFVREKEIKSIIDFGCGSGYVGKKILESGYKEKYIPIDIINVLEDMFFENTNRELKVISDYSELGVYKRVDLFFTVSVLMHIPPNQLAILAEHIKKIDSKYVFLSEVSYSSKPLKNNYIHDYKSIFSNMELLEVKQFKNRSNYIFIRR